MKYVILAKNDKIASQIEEADFVELLEIYIGEGKTVEQSLSLIRKELFKKFLHT